MPLTDAQRARYEWQLWVEGFDEAAQEKLSRSSVLVTRCGGVGSPLAYQLAAAGVGRLVLAHAGDLKPSDLNRQLLMHHAGLGRSRVEQAAARLRAFHPDLVVETVPANASPENAAGLVASVDVVAACAPLFEERLALNREAVRQGKPLVDAAMFEMELQLTTVLPGRSACLACLYPEVPPAWQRRFPVFGAVSGTVGCLGAMEVIKVLAGLGQPLTDRLLIADLRAMAFRTLQTRRRSECPVCGSDRGSSTPETRINPPPPDPA